MDYWKQARAGDFRGAAEAAHAALRGKVSITRRVEMRLVAAFCAMRQGNHGDAAHELDAAGAALDEAGGREREALRVAAWRAELAYFQGRYSAAEEIIGRILPDLERAKDHGYIAFARRTQIAILLARADYEGIASIATAAVRAAERSGDAYVRVQVLNILGAVHFDRATSKLAEPHARAHLSALDAQELAPMRDDATAALRFFEEARDVAMAAGYEFAAWYVSGNIERLQILLGRADVAVRAIRKRLRLLQQRGAKYDEIVTRSNLAWALRLLGRHADALHELDVALDLARQTGTFNVLLEFIHYDRSVVLDALGDSAGARTSYRRYLRLASGGDTGRQNAPPSAARKRPLEPFFLKRADRFIEEHLADPIPIDHVARHCGVSARTLEKAFNDFRGLTPVVHVRNRRLDEAHRALAAREGSVVEVSARCGFGSSTTFALEYRRRFGVSPSQTLAAARKSAPSPETCGIE
jgi:AraC-like DNA-binding protein/tetratricopeptide (TPR) repeat protein